MDARERDEADRALAREKRRALLIEAAAIARRWGFRLTPEEESATDSPLMIHGLALDAAASDP
jgi:hypothetical protein